VGVVWAWCWLACGALCACLACGVRVRWAWRGGVLGLAGAGLLPPMLEYFNLFNPFFCSRSKGETITNNPAEQTVCLRDGKRGDA
jgi:hypothetical protein